MKVTPTELPGVVLVQARVFEDDRGLFLETFHAARFAAAGLPSDFVQDNRSRSRRHVVRGLHYQLANPQGKLVSCARGAVWDVAVDVRIGSPTFGRWTGVTLTDEPGAALYIPPGFAHGFCALDDDSELIYKCTAAYDAADDRGVLWNDPVIGIEWPAGAPHLSAKDVNLPTLAEAEALGFLPRYVP
jgi:dTDP-4-dehydrorhamnose 3,5-epimerase